MRLFLAVWRTGVIVVFKGGRRVELILRRAVWFELVAANRSPVDRYIRQREL